MISLDDYLEAAGAEPWAWGRMDCAHFGGDWVRAATGRDPLGALRGAYTTAAGARRVILAAGGLGTAVGVAMARQGFERTATPDHGALAVMEVERHGEFSVARASVVIRSGPWWIGRTLDGLAGTQGPILAAWKVFR